MMRCRECTYSRRTYIAGSCNAYAAATVHKRVEIRSSVMQPPTCKLVASGVSVSKLPLSKPRAEPEDCAEGTDYHLWGL